MNRNLPIIDKSTVPTFWRPGNFGKFYISGPIDLLCDDNGVCFAEVDVYSAIGTTDQKVRKVTLDEMVCDDEGYIKVWLFKGIEHARATILDTRTDEQKQAARKAIEAQQKQAQKQKQAPAQQKQAQQAPAPARRQVTAPTGLGAVPAPAPAPDKTAQLLEQVMGVMLAMDKRLQALEAPAPAPEAPAPAPAPVVRRRNQNQK